VEVPKLLGLGLEKAKKEAEEAGLELAIQWVALAETATGVVLSQDPRAGETVAPAAKVTVSVNRP
jgi:beta-lactam-binding protein with PASTA domain